MKSSTLILGLATVLIATGCTELKSGFTVDGNQKIARAEGPVSDPFRQALANGYKGLADDQYAEKDMSSSDLFYRKSANAASGITVAPEDPKDWSSLRDSDRNDVAAMRSSLITWIAATKQLNPQDAAAQQIKYECWLEELSEQEFADAAACKPSIGPIAQAAPAPMAALTPCQQNPNGTDQNGKLCQEGVVYFGFDRYDLLNPGKTDISKQTAGQQASALDLIMRQVVASKATRLDVYGRADSSGPDNYNYGLSDCRARSVADALKARGLPAGVEVRVIPLGESSLVAPTADNVRDNSNRVVMVAYQTNRNAPLAMRPVSAPRVDAFGCGTTRHPYPLRIQKSAAAR